MMCYNERSLLQQFGVEPTDWERFVAKQTGEAYRCKYLTSVLRLSFVVSGLSAC